MSCLLEAEEGAIPHPLSLSGSQVIPYLLFYFGKDGPKLGVYCCLLSTLITDSKWKLLMEGGNPVQLSRNRACFFIPGKYPCFITITDSFSTFFHVSLTFPSDVSTTNQLQICEGACPMIRETILTGIRKASRKLNYSNSIPEIAFVCSSHHPFSLHPATLADADLLTCTTHPGSVFCEMTQGHKLWLGKAPDISGILNLSYVCFIAIIIAELISARHWIVDCGPGIGSCIYVCPSHFWNVIKAWRMCDGNPICICAFVSVFVYMHLHACATAI